MDSKSFQRAVPGVDDIREILVRRVDQQKQSVGIVVGVIEPTGRRIVAHGHLASGDPRVVDGDTIFEIGSVSKVFTLPERNGKAITLLDLATHSSGLPSLPTNLKPKDPRNPYADYGVEDLYQFLSGYALSRDPGYEFEYSNLGAGLLGHLLACRIGTDYESAIRIRITEPLRMRDTAMTLSSAMKQRMATGHNAMLTPVANWDFLSLAGAGALRASANDLLAFLEAFLGYTASPIAPAMRATVDVRRSLGKIATGLGWMMSSVHDRDIAAHDGGTGGFRSWIGCDLRERIGVVVLSNAATPLGVFDIGIHLLDQKWPLANPEAPTHRTEIAIDPRLLDHYAGRYQVTPHLVLEITRDADRLFAQAVVQGNTGPKFELFAESEKTFFAKVSDT